MANLIPAEFQPFVSDAVASGRYRSEDELIAAALRLLEERERRLTALREDIRIGIDELDRGEGIDLSNPSARQAFFDDIKARGRQRLTAQAKASPQADLF